MSREPIYSNHQFSPPPSDAIATCVAHTSAAIEAAVALAVVAMILAACLIVNPSYLWAVQ